MRLYDGLCRDVLLGLQDFPLRFLKGDRTDLQFIGRDEIGIDGGVELRLDGGRSEPSAVSVCPVPPASRIGALLRIS